MGTTTSAPATQHSELVIDIQDDIEIGEEDEEDQSLDGYEEGSEDGQEAGDGCFICGQSLVMDEGGGPAQEVIMTLCALACGHRFHQPCIQIWTERCPLCLVEEEQ